MDKAQSFPKFEYPPLESPRHIRLIAIQSSQGPGDLVVISFTSTSLHQPCQYQTLSYTWGEKLANNQHLTDIILCDGKQLRVTANLNNFLKRFRDQPRDRCVYGSHSHLPIWIDALSIDQANLSERSEQVAMMGVIYNSAHQLNVWLGEFDIPESIGDPFWPGPTGQGSIEPDQAMVEKIVNLPWFERRWVIQEVVNTNPWNTIIWIGNREISWYALSELVEKVTTSTVPEILKQHTKVEKDGRKGNSLLQNMERYDHALCNDPRDRIYALLSISLDGSKFDVDYHNDKDETYKRVAERIVEYASPSYVASLLIAALTRSRDDPDPSPPFWAPRWCNHRGYVTLDEEAAFEEALEEPMRSQQDRPLRSVEDFSIPAAMLALRNARDRANGSFEQSSIASIRHNRYLRLRVYILPKHTCTGNHR